MKVYQVTYQEKDVIRGWETVTAGIFSSREKAEERKEYLEECNYYFVNILEVVLDN